MDDRLVKGRVPRILDWRMTERQAVRSSLDEAVIEVLERFGVADALDVALAQAGASGVPVQREACIHFFEHALLDVLTGRVHPATARTIVDELLEDAASPAGSGMRMKREHQMPTVPPPSMEDSAYDDLASGAVHTRATPAWGLRRADIEAEGAIGWIVVSLDAELRTRLTGHAPVGTELMTVASVAELRSALERAPHPSSCVVIDAAQPSVPLDQAIAALIEHAGNQRIVLWRMDRSAYQLLVDAVPVARTWLSCEAEVTPIEIMQLIGA